jgi:inorganic pyrophosphatase
MSEELSTIFPDWVATVGIPLSAVAGVIFAIWLWYRVSLIQVRGGTVSTSETGREYLLEEEQHGEGEVCV